MQRKFNFTYFLHILAFFLFNALHILKILLHILTKFGQITYLASKMLHKILRSMNDPIGLTFVFDIDVVGVVDGEDALVR